MNLRLILLLLSFYDIFFAFSQNVSFDLGCRYVFADNIGGPMYGLTLVNKSEKFGISYSSSYFLRIGERIDSTGNSSTTYYSIVDLKKSNSVDVIYFLKGIKHKRLGLGAGYSWVYCGKGIDELFNKDNGYSAIYLTVLHDVLWLNVFIRAEIPLDEGVKLGLKSNLAPISIGLKYAFTPKKYKS
jgi:hypothetical protein